MQIKTLQSFAALSLSLALVACNQAAPNTQATATTDTAWEAPAQAPANSQTLTATFRPDLQLSPQITQGEVVGRGERPYQVALYYSGRQFCGGTLIAPNWVMTAAHCLSGRSTSGLRVRAGVNQLNTTQGQQVAVATAYAHPEYTKASRGYDIALLKLSSNVTNAYADTAKLPSNEIESILDVAGNYATVTGWGRTESSNSSKALLEVTIPITPNPTQCGGAAMPDNVICGEYEADKDSCNGDSGGPLATSYQGNFYVLGTVSFGPDACRGYGVYTRTNAYLDWIEEISGITPDSDTSLPIEPPPAAPGKVTYEGDLGRRDRAYAPNTTGAYYKGGRIIGDLTTPAGTNFHLYLQRRDDATGQYKNVAYNIGLGNSKSVNHYATAGHYRWVVYSFWGEGKLQLLETKY